MIARLLILLALFAAPPLKADERPPRYDVDGHCATLANTPDGFSDETMARCLSAQSEALDSVRRVWPGAPDYIQRDCDLRARVERDEDYLILDRCVRTQLRQEQADIAPGTGGKAKTPPNKKKPAPKPQPQ